MNHQERGVACQRQPTATGEEKTGTKAQRQRSEDSKGTPQSYGLRLLGGGPASERDVNGRELGFLDFDLSATAAPVRETKKHGNLLP